MGSRRLGQQHLMEASYCEASSCLPLSLRLVVVHFFNAEI
ncbi:hypothetical protein ACHAXR_010468 [Thalassiosira sp. AJA248-18]